MLCGKAQCWLSVSLDGELDSQREKSLRAHLESCPNCQAFAADIGCLAAVLDSATVMEPRVGFAGRVVARIEDVEPGIERPAGWLRILRPIPVGVGVAAFCAGMSLVLLANGQAESDEYRASDAVTLLADSCLGTTTAPALEDELVHLMPPSGD